MAYWTKCKQKALPFVVLLLLGFFELVFSKRLQVHMIVNSHMDLGWTSTVEEYFYGYNTRYGESAKDLFNSVFDSLWNNTDRTYSMSELGFLEIWWNQQSQEKKDKVLKIIERGQLEIVNGGWVGNDEATAMYDDIIENFIVGQRWAKENLNNTNSTVGFQMDSFGSSVTQAYLLKEAGYEATFFSRVDNDERQRRKDTQTMDFNWNFPNAKGSMYTQLMARPYWQPILPRAKWISELFDGNFNESDYEVLIEELRKDREYFNTDHIVVLFSGDFYIPWYPSIDDIVRYFKDHPEHEIDVFYSNLGKFVKEVKQELVAESKNLTDKYGDFFPLNEEPGTVWTGFYTSKSAFKGYVRWHSRYLTAAKLLVSQRAMRHFETSNATEYTELNSALIELEKAIAIVQHHDAVSGTMKERVRFDYEDILTKARKSLEDKLREILLEDLKSGLSEEAVIVSLNSTYDNLLGGFTSPEMSGSTLPADSDLLLAVMNPGNKRLFLITANTTHIPEYDTCVTVETSDGRTIFPDIICPESESAECTIYFTDTIEAYAGMYYQIKIANGQGQCGELLSSEDVSSRNKIVGSHWTLQIDEGNVFTFLKDEVEKQFKLSYSYFESAIEDRGNHHASGAYIFMPSSHEKKSLSTKNQTVVWIGNHIAIVQIQSANFTTTIQVLIDQEQTGFSVITQLSPIKDTPNGCEIVMEITVPELQADGKFFTDANGYFMLERPYVQASANETPEDEISKNYHPMTTRCSLEGNNGTEAFTVFTDRAQGVSIQKDNEINIMIHRVAVMDDDEGLYERLYEGDRYTYLPETDQIDQPESNQRRKEPEMDHTFRPRAVTTWHYFLWNDLLDQQPEREQTQYNSERPLRIWLFSVNNTFSVDSIVQNSDLPSHLPKSLKVNMRTYSQNDHSIRLQNLDPNNKLSVLLSGNSQNSPSLISYLSQNSRTGLASLTETYWTTTQVRGDSSHFDLSHPVEIELAPLQMRTFQISVRQLKESTVTPQVEYGTNNPIPSPGNTSNNTSDNTTNSTTVPDSSHAKEGKEEATRIPEIEEAVSRDHNSSSLIGLGYYMIFHACVGVTYFIRCCLQARKRNIPLSEYQQDILIVAALGPIGFAVLCYLHKDKQEGKHEILPEIKDEIET